MQKLINTWDDIFPIVAPTPIANPAHVVPEPIKYADAALLASDEGASFAGLLVGLSVVDFCFVLKDNLERFNRPVRSFIVFGFCYQYIIPLCMKFT